MPTLEIWVLTEAIGSQTWVDYSSISMVLLKTEGSRPHPREYLNKHPGDSDDRPQALLKVLFSLSLLLLWVKLGFVCTMETTVPSFCKDVEPCLLGTWRLRQEIVLTTL